MARKCIRKLILVLMELLIIPILVQILHANDLPPTSFRPSSLPILLPQFSELDNVLGPLGKCLKTRTKDCKKRSAELGDLNYERCVERSYVDCMDDVEEHEDPIYPMMKKCVGDCVRANKGTGLVLCFDECYNVHIKNPSEHINNVPERFKVVPENLKNLLEKFQKFRRHP